ncbi:hypothetical protein DEH69_16780 [Streptomyces sp. PT12]|nr:hypothetical protein DEH69_16780 [Streptomyces sp. PT12]
MLGASTLTGAILLLVATVERAAHTTPARGLTTLAASLALFAAFVVIERRAAAPLVRLGILRSAALVRANVGGPLAAAALRRSGPAREGAREDAAAPTVTG